MSSAKLFIVAIFVCVGCTTGMHTRGIKVDPYPIGAHPTDQEFSDARTANARNEAGVPGIRYYERSLYLLAWSDTKGGLNWQILSLPDPTKKRAISIDNFTSKFETKLEFDNGTLSGFPEKADSTAVAGTVLDQLKALAPLIVKSFMPLDAPPPKAPAPHLYKIIVRGNTIVLRGGQGDLEIPMASIAEKKAS